MLDALEEAGEYMRGITADDDETSLKVAGRSSTDDGAPTAAEDVAQNQAHSTPPSVHSLPVRHASSTHLTRPSTAPSPLAAESAFRPSEAVRQVTVSASGRQPRHRSSNEVSLPGFSDYPAGFDWPSSRFARRIACLVSFQTSSIVVIQCPKLCPVYLVIQRHLPRSNTGLLQIRGHLLPLCQPGQPLPRLRCHPLLFAS